MIITPEHVNNIHNFLNNLDSTIVHIAIGELQLSSDVGQFKSGANTQGVVRPLSGIFSPIGTSPVQVWERSDGRLEVISGRHKFDLAERSDTEQVPCQIHKEVNGFSQEDARLLDIIINIRENQGNIKDYVRFFQGFRTFFYEDIQALGLLDRDIGEIAYQIATKGSSLLIDSYLNGQLSDKEALELCICAPHDEKLQTTGMKLLTEKIHIDVVKKTIMMTGQLRYIIAGKDNTMDLFGDDIEETYKKIVRIFQYVEEKKRNIKKELHIFTTLIKNSKLLQKNNITISDENVKNIQAAIDQCKKKLQQLDGWYNDSQTTDQLVEEILCKQ